MNRAQLLKDLQRMLTRLTDDVRQRAGREDVAPRLRKEYEEAREAGRTGESCAVWSEGQYTQSAAAWILGTVFVRFLEDHRLIDPVYLAGEAARLAEARERQQLYFQGNPTGSDRDYLQFVFEDVSRLPGVRPLYDHRHNPLWRLPLSGDGATLLLDFLRKIDPETGALVRDFVTDNCDTRFLGDLYQDLSAEARSRFALLQTPEFVEEFILDRTLTPAIETFGYQKVRLIDPTCGSGHFLLGAFHRLLALWTRHRPGDNPRGLVQNALDQVYGVDLNPYATNIAYFRLLVAALVAAGETRLARAPDFRIHLATGDSLLHGRRFVPGETLPVGLFDDDPLRQYVLAAEDQTALDRILGQQYHAVVGNPPYITVKDPVLNQAYRVRFQSCHRKYQLVVPFIERFFSLALPSTDRSGGAAGFSGMIVSNAFMKREFGKKLIEDYFPLWDLTHVVDASGAYIPGHGTPTALLFGRNRKPVGSAVRAVMGIRGEPTTPDDPARGLVWSAIVDQVDQPGSLGDFVSVSDVPRETFHKHPWSLGGGGAAELKERLEEAKSQTLGDCLFDIGRTTHSGEDDFFYLPSSTIATRGWGAFSVPLVTGESVRDFLLFPGLQTIFPYDKLTAQRFDTIPERLGGYYWCFRACLKNRKDFGQTIEKRGLRWFEHSMFFPGRYRSPLSITFAFVATHNHFVLDRGGKVFKQSAPVIKLKPEATEDDHLALLGLLNSSIACFWMKQIYYPKGGDHVGTEGARVRKTLWDERFEFDGTKLSQFPLVPNLPLDYARLLDQAAQNQKSILPEAVLAGGRIERAALNEARDSYFQLRSQMIALQEELDWHCYHLYGLTDDDLVLPVAELPGIVLGERAFEIVLARKMAAGEQTTTWFERHGSTPITAVPAHWPAAYRELVERRIAAIEENPEIALIEKPEYKRRWSDEPWEEKVQAALREFLLERIEAPAVWPEARLQSALEIGDRLRNDSPFLAAAELFAGRRDVDLTALVAELALGEGVPFLAALRYTESGLRKRREWEQTWALQREEDAGKTIAGGIPVPPKYDSKDFQKASFWRLRGKLDVPKERFILYPGAERQVDPTPVFGWAGWDHLEQARSLANYYEQRRTRDGWDRERLLPLLAGIHELLPWLQQWHNDLDPETRLRMGDFFAHFIHEEARRFNQTPDQLAAWSPPVSGPRRGRKAKAE